MNKPIRRLNAPLSLLCAVLLVLLAAVPASAAAIHFEKESLHAYEGQLHKGEVHALTFHPGSGGSAGHLHISLNDGEHMTVTYLASEQGKLVAQAQAANARVKIAAVLTKKKAAPVKHKLRYIAGGILIVVIIVVLIVLLVGRRRAIEAEPHETAGESTASS